MGFKLRICKHEVGLWFRHGDFVRPLGPGPHWMLTGPMSLGRNRVEVKSVLDVKFDHSMADILLENEELRDRLVVLDLTATQRGLVWQDGRLAWILGPGRHAFWKYPHRIEVETYDVADFEFEHPKMDAILEMPGGSGFFDAIRVEAHQRLLLFRKGQFVGERGAGLYVFWKQGGVMTWKLVDLRQQAVDVTGQEIMTADKVTLRLNLVVNYVVNDPLQAVTTVVDYPQALYREAQLVLREAVGGRRLDELLADKDAVGREVGEMLAKLAAGLGLTVRSVGIRDIILPGDMKSILNQVIEAQKQAEANLILRREETAAARSQVNTAKLLANNPVLTRMKELEALQTILAGAKTTFVLGAGGLTDQVLPLMTRENGKDA